MGLLKAGRGPRRPNNEWTKGPLSRSWLSTDICTALNTTLYICKYFNYGKFWLAFLWRKKHHTCRKLYQVKSWTKCTTRRFVLSLRCFVVSLCHFVTLFRRLVHQFVPSSRRPVDFVPLFVTRLVVSLLWCFLSSFRFGYLTALAYEPE